MALANWPTRRASSAELHRAPSPLRSASGEAAVSTFGSGLALARQTLDRQPQSRPDTIYDLSRLRRSVIMATRLRLTPPGRPYRISLSVGLTRQNIMWCRLPITLPLAHRHGRAL